MNLNMVWIGIFFNESPIQKKYHHNTNRFLNILHLRMVCMHALSFLLYNFNLFKIWWSFIAVIHFFSSFSFGLLFNGEMHRIFFFVIFLYFCCCYFFMTESRLCWLTNHYKRNGKFNQLKTMTENRFQVKKKERKNQQKSSVAHIVNEKTKKKQ